MPSMISWLGRLRGRNGPRCGICGKEIAAPGVERHGRHFCNEWHAARYFPRWSFWRRLWEAGDRSTGGGGCCR